MSHVRRLQVRACMPLFIAALTVGSIASIASADWMYWTERINDRVLRVGLDGTGEEVLLTGVDGVEFLAIDDAGGHMYYTLETGDIYRAGLDGSNPVMIADTTRVKTIAFNPVDGLVYYQDSPPNATIKRMAGDGSGLEEFSNLIGDLGGAEWNGMDFDPVNNEVFVSQRTGSTGSIYAISLADGSQYRTVMQNGARAADVRVDWQGRRLYWLDRSSDAVYTSDMDGADRINLGGVGAVTALEIDVQNQDLYFNDNLTPWGIVRSDLDLANQETLVTLTTSGANMRISRPSCLSLDVTELVSGEVATVTVSHDPLLGPVEIAVVYSLSTGEFSREYVAGWCVSLGLDLGNRPLDRVLCYGETVNGALVCDVQVPNGFSGAQVYMQAATRLTCPGVCQSPVTDRIIQ